jgi:TPR repeat protein
VGPGDFAVLTFRNNDDLFSLTGVVNEELELETQKALLRYWWSVGSREELLDTLQGLMEKGHRARFNKIRKEQEKWPKWLLNFRDKITQKDESWRYLNRVEFVKEHSAEMDAVSLTGWDMARVVSLARWGVACGYLEPDEAWDWIMPAAVAIQQTYTSWEELGESYLLGRQFWSATETADNGFLYQESVYWLTHNEQSPWTKFDWNLDLTASSVPEDEAVLPETQLCYLGAFYDAFDLPLRAEEVLKRAVHEGPALSRGNACDWLGDIYSYGRSGIQTNAEKALELYKQGAALNNTDSLLEVGMAYYAGEGVEQDYEQAFEYWTRAAAQGSPMGLLNLAMLYHEGEGVEQDLQQAIELYEEATLHGSTLSENGEAWLLFEYDEVWDADRAVELAYEGVYKRYVHEHFDTLVRVLMKAERWDEAWYALNAWEQLNMRQRNNYDPLEIPKEFRVLRAEIRLGMHAQD